MKTKRAIGKILAAIAAIIFLSAPAVSAKTYIQDSVPEGAIDVGYTQDSQIYNKRLDSPLVMGFLATTRWSGFNTGDIRASSTAQGGLQYPAASLLSAPGLSFRVNGSAGINRDAGRLIQRLFDFAQLPKHASGNSASNFVCDNDGSAFYVSALAKASNVAAWDAFPDFATFIGCGTVNRTENAPADPDQSNSQIPRRFPSDGLQFGFSSKGLEMSAAGKRAALIPQSALANDETYFCIARVDVNAHGTRERVRAVALPVSTAGKADLLTQPAQWTADIIVDLFNNNKQFTYLHVGGATAPNVFFDEFRMTASWLGAVYADTGIEIGEASATIAGDFVDATATLTSSTPTNELFLCFGSRDFGSATNGWELVVPFMDANPALDGVVYSSPSVPLSSLPKDIALTISALAFDGAGGDARVVGSAYVPDPDTSDFVWIGAVDEFASNAANWANNTVPDKNAHIILNAASHANMVWDYDGVNGLSDEVSSWTQTDDYTGTVVFPINFPDVADAAFTNFTVNGDAHILGGAWSHGQNLATREFRLAATVKGDLTVGADGKLDVTGMGYSAGNGAAANLNHGGNANNVIGATYGDPKWPVDIGGYANNVKGGGAILLNVTGAARVDGTVAAGGTNGSSVNRTGGAGGSVLILAQSLDGLGMITANGGGASDGGGSQNSGSGGRIAVHTDAPMAFDTNKVFAAGYVASSGGSGAGTVFLKTPAESNGTLVVNNNTVSRVPNHQFLSFGRNAVTPVNAGETWAFDRVVIANYGVLAVYPDSGLILPNGLASVSSLSHDRIGGIKYLGGTLDIGAGPQTISGGWTFQSAAPFEFVDDLSVVNGGAIGFVRLYQGVADSLDAYHSCDITVNGDMFVDSSSFIEARRGGWWNNNGTYEKSTHGGAGGHVPGALPYGSVFQPRLPSPGNYQNSDFWSGAGAMKLTVTGELRLDGEANADGLGPNNDSYNDTNIYSSGGSLDFTLGSLSGSGSISAKGGVNKRQGMGSGGRIAIRLTVDGATFDGWLAKIVANGRTILHNNAPLGYTRSSSAGTIYLEVAADSDKSGLIIVRNDNNANSPEGIYTPLPAPGPGSDAAEDFEVASLHIEQYGRVSLANDLKINFLTADATAKIQLAGKTLRVAECNVAGVKLGAGAYTAENLAGIIPYFLIDDSALATGQLIVQGSGTMLIIR